MSGKPNGSDDPQADAWLGAPILRSGWDEEAIRKLNAEAAAYGRPALATVGPDGAVHEEIVLPGVPDAEQRDLADSIATGLGVYTPSERTALLHESPRILDRFAEAIARTGLAGEERTAQLLYLVVTTRYLDRLVSVAVKGPSSGGKSYLVAQVLSFFPPPAYRDLTAMSERALIYDEEPIAHRFLVLYEAAGMAGDVQTYLVRSLLSEGRIRYVVAEKTKEGIRGRTIERDGPTGLIVTTTAIRLHPENETRLFSITVSDTPAQTAAVLAAQAGAHIDTVDRAPWHDLHERVGEGMPGVLIPYAVPLAHLIPPVAVRLRRDFPAILALVRAHALLHRATRERADDGSVLATIDDYAVVRELVADLVDDAAERSVPESVRETVATVRRIGGDEVSIPTIAVELGLDRSAASRRVRAAIDRGYLKNLEDRRGRPARVTLGDPLPAESPVLPLPEVVQSCSAPAGGIHPTAADADLVPAARAIFGDDLVDPALLEEAEA